MSTKQIFTDLRSLIDTLEKEILYIDKDLLSELESLCRIVDNSAQETENHLRDLILGIEDLRDVIHSHNEHNS